MWYIELIVMKVELGESTELESEKTKNSRISFREIVGIGSERFGRVLRSIAKRGIRFGAPLLLFVATLLSPIDSPVRAVNAESNPQQANSLTLLHGDGSRDRFNIMLLRDQGVTDQMLQDVAADIFLIPPTNEFKDKVNVYTKNPEEDLKCGQNAACDWGGAVKREIDRIAASGITPHETMMVIKSNDRGGAGQALLASSFGPPDIYTSSAVVRPVSRPPELREFGAATVAHELWGHTFAGFGHEGNDIMASPRAGSFFNPQHSQYLRDLMKLTPYNYLTPANEIRLQSRSSLSVVPPQEDGISAVVSTPTGTRQLISRIRPVNGDGQSIIEHVKDLGIIHAWSEIGKKIPYSTLLPGKDYLWQVCSSGLLIPLPAEDPRWREVEAWPGKLFLNPCVEVTFRTPGGVYKVYLPVAPK